MKYFILTGMIMTTLLMSLSQPSQAFNQEDMDKLLKTKKCKKCDLSGVNLEGADLKNYFIAWSDLTGANLNNADLRGASFYKCNLKNATFTGANLSKEGNYGNVGFAETNLTNIDLSKIVSANLRAYFSGAELRGANLSDLNLQGVNFQGANLQNANLQNANLQSAKMEGADLRSAILSGANFWKAYVRGTLFDEAGREYAEKGGANFQPDQRIDSE